MEIVSTIRSKNIEVTWTRYVAVEVRYFFGK